jgi:hypothetical protein
MGLRRTPDGTPVFASFGKLARGGTDAGRRVAFADLVGPADDPVPVELASDGWGVASEGPADPPSDGDGDG